MTPLSALGAIERGFHNLRANWELLLVYWLQSMILVALLAAGLLPVLLLLGLGETPWSVATGPDDLVRWLDPEHLTARLSQALAPLILVSLACLTIWSLAGIVYCFMLGGIYGVLMGGERQCPPGPARDWSVFRTFSIPMVLGWGRRYVWRYFWLINLFLAFLLVAYLLMLFLILLTIWAFDRWGEVAALGFGCGGALPMIFGFMVLSLWMMLAQADLAREESGVWLATRQALRVLGHRLGAVVLIVVLAFLAGLVLGGVILPLQIFGGLANLDPLAVSITVTVLQWALGGLWTLVLAATLIALVRHEALQESGA